MIQHIIFDFGNVLVATDTARVMRPYFQSDTEAEQFLQRMDSPNVMRHFDLEDIPFIQVVHTLQQQYPQWEKQLMAFHKHAAEFAYAEMPEMYDLLARLRGEGFHLYGLTNWGAVVHDVMRRFPIFQLLDGTVISSDVHLLKPNPEIYELLLNRYHLRADQCLFTDDKIENINGAQAVGITSVQFLSAQQLDDFIHSMPNSALH